MKKILFLNLYTEMGGGEQALLSLLKGINKVLFQPVLLVNKDGPLLREATRAGIKSLIIPFRILTRKKYFNLYYILIDFIASLRILYYIKRNKIDLIHCGDLFSLVLFIPVRIFIKIPIVYYLIFFGDNLRIKLLRFLGKRMVSRFAACSDAIKNDFVERTGFDKSFVKTIRNGIDPEIFTIKDRNYKIYCKNKLNLPSDKILISLIARFEIWKGHSVFINAAELLLKKRNDIIFGILGGSLNKEIYRFYSVYEESVKNQIKTKKLEENILLFGHRNDIPEVIHSMDILVCPSKKEPFGLVLLEAMASGIPVISSDSGGPLEIIKDGENGLLFQTDNYNLLAEKIELLLGNEELYRKLVVNGRTSVEKHFTQNIYVKNFEELYNEILNIK
jgi:glycosyltransferase involved in cell wall biosynthesis